MNKIISDSENFYKIIKSEDGIYLQKDIDIRHPNFKNTLREDFTEVNDKYYLTSNITDKFLDANKYRSDYDKLMIEKYHF
jgi:hypothetical protein